MKKEDIKVGLVYLARVSDKVVPVRVDSITESPGNKYRKAHTRYHCTNLVTKRKITMESAQRFRGLAPSSGGKQVPPFVPDPLYPEVTEDFIKEQAAKVLENARNVKEDEHRPDHSSGAPIASPESVEGSPTLIDLKCGDRVDTPMGRGTLLSDGPFEEGEQVLVQLDEPGTGDGLEEFWADDIEPLKEESNDTYLEDARAEEAPEGQKPREERPGGGEPEAPEGAAEGDAGREEGAAEGSNDGPELNVEWGGKTYNVAAYEPLTKKQLDEYSDLAERHGAPYLESVVPTSHLLPVSPQKDPVPPAGVGSIVARKLKEAQEREQQLSQSDARSIPTDEGKSTTTSPEGYDVRSLVRRGGEHLIVRARAGCLAGDTIIQTNRAGYGRKYRLEEVVTKFNGGQKTITREYLMQGRLVRSVQKDKPWNLSIPTLVARADGPVIKLGRLKNAWFSGEKETFKVTTETGKTIRATAIHPFLLGCGEWVQLQELNVGDVIKVNSGRSAKGRKPKTRTEDWWDTRYHPHQTSNGSGRFKVMRHRLVIEADLNGLTLSNYLWILRHNEERAAGLLYLEREQIVHHRNQDSTDHRLSNLQVVDGQREHSAEHEWVNNVLWQVGEEAIVGIEPYGMEPTYDLEMEDDPHNFLANDFVVHNTGKTTTLVEGMKRALGLESPLTPSDQQALVWEAMAESAGAKSIGFVAFNSSIAQELKRRVPSGTDAMTMHSMGFKAVCKTFGLSGRDATNKYRVDEIVARLLGEDLRELQRRRPGFLGPIKEVVKLCKMRLVGVDDRNNFSLGHADWGRAINEIVNRYDVDFKSELDEEDCHALVPQIMEACLDPRRDGCIDFDDQIWLAVVARCRLWEYDLLCVDECVPGWTPVMLANGGSRTIEEIVESTEDVWVRAYDVTTKEERNCKVIARQKILNQKPLVKVVVKHRHKTGTNYKSNFVVCTTDHKIWTTNRGWVEAGKLVLGDEAIVETAAPTTQKGKITEQGRANLATLQVGNRRGVGNTGGSKEQFNRIKGGNGRGPTLAEQVLIETLGEGWGPLNVLTGDAPQYGRGDKPSHYKLDVANEKLKIVIEVDGPSHRGREEQDVRKQEFLEGQGWTMIRVSNRRAIQETDQVVCEVLGNCPRPAVVVALESVIIPDSYVYDITVEGCHNFYANGVLVHNCQDLNPAQQRLVMKAGRRLVICGDDRQAIYGFTGADTDGLPTFEKALGATSKGCNLLPLTVTRRCGRAIVEEAKKLVPDFEAHESNGEGLVGEAKYPIQEQGGSYWTGRGKTVRLPFDQTYLRDVAPGDMVICRVNAHLVLQCTEHHKRGNRAFILGRQYGDQYLTFIDKMDCTDIASLIGKVTDWKHEEMEKEQAKRHPSDSKLMNIEAKADTIVALCDGMRSITDLQAKVKDLFDDNVERPGVLHATIHKAKGLEANNVWFLMPKGAGCPHPMAKTPWAVQQEWNCKYIGITRAIDSMTYVS